MRLLFNFLSQQFITLVLFLAISNSDILHTQGRDKTPELYTETSVKGKCMALDTLTSILLPVIFYVG